jgi:putative N6-adenine-specific DNA methylase
LIDQQYSSATFIAKTISGLEEVLATELRQLGASEVAVLRRAVSFKGNKALLYKANYWLRTALRILVPLTSFDIADEKELYTKIYDFNWEDIFDVDQTIALDAVVTDSPITHSHYASLKSKDAIVDRFRNKYGRRPSVDIENPDIRINLHIYRNKCDVSLDSSGISLHKRGYRQAIAEAPLSEVLAAGLILLSGWDKKSNFIDPMCGSGTLLIEAALIANNFPPGQYRDTFGFMRWNDYDNEIWNKMVDESLDQQVEFDNLIIGSDISERNLAAARGNIRSALMHKDIELQVSPFETFEPPQGPGILMMNPPYGERIQVDDIIKLYQSIGDRLKTRYSGFDAWIISADLRALKFIGLKPTAKYPVFNGQLECRFAHFSIYSGSKRLRAPGEGINDTIS